MGSRPSARPRNEAIWSRRTSSRGQNNRPSGSHPSVIPAWAMALMFSSWGVLISFFLGTYGLYSPSRTSRRLHSRSESAVASLVVVDRVGGS